MAKSGTGHEDLSRNEEIKVGADRTFGFVFAAFCAIVAGFMLWEGRPAFWGWIGTASVFAVLATFLSGALHPLNVLWFKFGMLLHHIINPVVLGLMYFLVFTPTGLWMRMVGKRPLNLRFEPGAKSYWVHRQPPGPPPDSYNNQF